jgi:hypothetical protein
MDGKPPTEKAASLYFFSGEECNFSFFLEKKTIFFFLMLLAWKKKAILCVDLLGSIKT